MSDELPNCNYIISEGEFYSNTFEKYNNKIKENDKKKKIFSIGLYANIVIFFITIIVFFIIFRKNKKDIETGVEQITGKNINIQSPWSTGVIILLIISILCFLSSLITAYNTYKYSVKEEKPTINDLVRPCYSKKNEKIIIDITNTEEQNRLNPQRSGVSGSIAGSQVGQTDREQNMDSQNVVTSSGLEQLGVEVNVNTNQTQNTENQDLFNQTVNANNLDSTTNFNLNQDQISTTNVGVTSAVTGDGNVNTNVTSGTTTSGSVTLFT
jgi:heme/copper-type cytochrome/quinol oxidase subunit 2